LAPVIFQTLPDILSFVVAVLLLQVSAILLATGRKFLRQASFIAAGVAGAGIGEKLSLSMFPEFAWLAIGLGLAMGVLLCYYSRPIAVGVALGYLAFFSSTYLVDIADAQWVVALVLFVYGLLLTDIAPTFISSLLASAILILAGIWLGVPTSLLFVVVSVIGGLRILAELLPLKTQTGAVKRRSVGIRMSKSAAMNN